MKRYTIVGFGDSITLARRQPEEKRWLSILERELNAAFPARGIVTVNAGAGGNTSREGLARIEHDVLAHDPDMVLVEFGGNDATADIARHVSLGEYVLNLDELVRRIKERNSGARIALLTFPPIIDAWHASGSSAFHRPYGGGDACVERYRNATRDFAAAHTMPLIDIDEALRAACDAEGKERFILPDGVHLTEEGNAVVARVVTPVVSAWMTEE